jgi:polysaccharide biosynthesis transport protein
MSDDNICMNKKAQAEEIDVQKYGMILKRRFPVIAVVLITAVGLSTLIATRQKPAYEAVAKILVKAERSSSLTGIDVKIGELDALGPSQQKDPAITQVETIKSLPIFQKAMQLVPTPAGQPPQTAESLLEHFKIKSLSGTDVLQISYQSDNSQYATAIVEAVVNEYIASNVDANREEAAVARRFIASQLPKTEAAVHQAEMALRQFKEQGNIIALTQETGQAVTNIGNLDTQIDQAKAGLADATARSAQFRQQLGVNPQAAVELGALRKSAGVQEVLTKLQTAQSQLVVERTRYRDNHPIVVNLRSQINALNGLLDQRVADVINRNQPVAVGKLQGDDLKQNLTASYLQSEVDVSGLSQRIAKLSVLQAAQKQRASTLPGLETTQRELERQLKAAQGTYEILLTKLQEVQVAEHRRVANVRVVQPATAPQKPSPSRKMLILAAGSIAGLILGVAAALILDLLDQSVSRLKGVKEQFDYPLLGVIPLGDRQHWWRRSPSDVHRQVPRIVSGERPASIERKAYEMLQSNLAFLSYDRKLKSILVTSSMDGEGKSAVAANLAMAMAQTGRRVLLVDTNMADPALHGAWDIPNAVGLSQVLMGKNRADEAVRDIMPHLDLLTAGGTVPDPLTLLDSNRMSTLMTAFAGRYDFVIVDAPAVNCWADASVLARVADGIVLVARPGILTIGAATAVKAKLASLKPKVLGMVANGVNVRQETDHRTVELKPNSINLEANHPVWDQIPLNSQLK